MPVSLVEDIGARVPKNMRLILVKRKCPKCAEGLRAVTKFNRFVGDSERIEISEDTDSGFQFYFTFFKKATGMDGIPTPIMFFDGHILYWPEGGLQWLELYYMLLSLRQKN